MDKKKLLTLTTKITKKNKEIINLDIHKNRILTREEKIKILSSTKNYILYYIKIQS